MAKLLLFIWGGDNLFNISLVFTVFFKKVGGFDFKLTGSRVFFLKTELSEC